MLSMVKRLAIVLAGAAMVAGMLSWAQSACAAELREIEVNRSQYFLEVRLGFDTKPSYTEAFRYDPDRYLLTFTGCKLAVPEDTQTALAEIDHSLLTRISTYQASANLQLGFYLNLPVQPLIRFDQQNYYLRFYTSVRAEQTTQLATGVSLVEKTSAYRDRNFHLYMVKVDPGSQVSLYTAAADRYDGKTRRREAASFARRESADVGVNGGFFGSAG